MGNASSIYQFIVHMFPDVCVIVSLGSRPGAQECDFQHFATLSVLYQINANINMCVVAYFNVCGKHSFRL